MKILKDQGTFTVLTKPENIISDIANSARTCYQSQDKASPENDLKLVKNLMTRGHFAMYEFSDMTIKFENCSRGFTHEMVRHRLCSFAQESTRYVDEKEFEFVVPPHRDENEKMFDSDDQFWFKTPKNWLELIGKFYRSLREHGWKPEDARQWLPNALHSQIVVKANIREWRHIFTMRCDKFAHWEIRAVMLKLLKWCQANIPVVFDDFKFFVTSEGIEYARPVMSALNLAEKINEYNQHFDLKDVVNKLDIDVSVKLYEILKEKFSK